jgi:hypothetical protein
MFSSLVEAEGVADPYVYDVVPRSEIKKLEYMDAHIRIFAHIAY